jgi:choline monooxygenase
MPSFARRTGRLSPFNVREWRGLVFVAIAPDRDLEHQLGDLITELADEPIESYQAVREERLAFDANWKIYTDNFVEGYHIPGIHRPSSPRSISSNSRQPRMMGWCA